MAGRKLSQHQKQRIQDAQEAISSSDDGHIEGLVISHHGGKIVVETDENRLIECSVKSNLGTIVCGDRVICESANYGTEARIDALMQ